MNAPAWNVLPTEMKFAVVAHLAANDIAAFSNSCREAYALSIPRLYREVRLRGGETLQTFLRTVPATYCQYVRVLSVDVTGMQCPTSATTSLSTLLAQCTEIEELDLRVAGVLQSTIVPFFRTLRSLRRLSISNCSEDDSQPLSERLVVSIAASVPHLSHLTLDRICRSAVHAPELLGAYPFVPVVQGDADVPAHPVLGDELSLPSLLRIPTLEELHIRDTHLGDKRWSTVSPLCQLRTLEIGSCCHASPDFNRSCAERVIEVAGRPVENLTLSSALPSDVRTPLSLKSLKTLRTTSLLPIENLAETLGAFCDSPIETLCLECHEDDVEDQCAALEDFLSNCNASAKRPSFPRLKRVSLSTVTDVLEPSPVKTPVFDLTLEDTSRGVTSAVQLLQECLNGFQCSSSCEPEMGAVVSPSPSVCRPVQDVMERMMWPHMTEAW